MEKTEKQLKMEQQLAEWRAKRAAKLGNQPLAPISINHSSAVSKPTVTLITESSAVTAAATDSAAQAGAARGPMPKMPTTSAARPKHQMCTKASQGKLRQSITETSHGSKFSEQQDAKTLQEKSSSSTESKQSTAPAQQRSVGMEDNPLGPVGEAHTEDSAPSVGHSHTIAQRLQTLREENGIGTSNPAQPSVSGNSGGSTQPERSLAALADELFGDVRFRDEVSRGMTWSLQRTCDGATQCSRILELSALVRLLRKTSQQMSSKNREFVSHSLKFEKNADQQVAAVRLAEESRRRQLEAALANAKRDGAQATTASKTAAAVYHGELEYQKAEVTRVKREVERLETERRRFHDECTRSEAVRADLETQLTHQRQQAATTQGRQQEQLASATATTERLQDELQTAKASMAESRQKALTAEAALHRHQLESDCWRTDVQTLTHTLELLRREHTMVTSQHADQQAAATAASAAAARTSHDLAAQQQRAASLAHQLESTRASLLTATTDAAKAAATSAVEVQHLQAACKEEAKQRQDAEAGQAVLEREKAAIMATLRDAQKEQAALQQRLVASATECAELQHQVSTAAGALAAESEQLAAARDAQASLQQRLDEAVEASRDLQQQLAAAQADAVEARQRAESVKAEATDQASRLAHLEGELGAFQEVVGAGDQGEMLHRLVSRVSSLELSVAAAEGRRRDLHNQLVQLRGNIRVFCRLRPVVSSSAECCGDGASVALSAEDGRRYNFTFDKVFGGTVAQAAIFAEVSELVQSALDGYQVCLFSYGQTGAGKTHTMQGTASPDGRGITPRALEQVLEAAEALREAGWQYQLEATYLEVYNEQLRDLLAVPATGRSAAGRAPPTLDTSAIKHDASGGPGCVVGATGVAITCAADANEVTRRAASARACEATAMNAASSRSHSVLTLRVTGSHEEAGTHLTGSLHLVDLAGSERLARSEVAGQRQKEACSINKSLSALGDVFAALSARASHIPYRNSTLTRLLQPCLGGDGKTLMFVNINPEPASVAESLCSLRFASKVNQCETGAKGGAKRHQNLRPPTTDQALGTKRKLGAATGPSRVTRLRN